MRFIISSNKITDIKKGLLNCTDIDECSSYLLTLPYFCLGAVKKTDKFELLKKELYFFSNYYSGPFYVYVFHNQMIYEGSLNKLSCLQYYRNVRKIDNDAIEEIAPVDFSESLSSYVIDSIVARSIKHNYNEKPLFCIHFSGDKKD